MRANGMTIADIGRVTGYSEPTVRKYAKRPEGEPVRYRKRPHRPTKLDPFREHVDRRMSEGVFNCRVLARELRSLGYTGGETQLRVYVRPHRRQFLVQASRRFETGPGEQGQVDWGYLGRFLLEGMWRPVWVFVLVLGYSRYLFAECVTDTTLPTLIWLHQKAFRVLGGVAKHLVYDNMRTVTLGRDEAGKPRWNEEFLRFAAHFGFIPRLTAPYKPRSKGKVEAAVRYLKGNFAPGRTFRDLADLNAQLQAWLAVANGRVHSTTGSVPAVRFLEEGLLPLPPFLYLISRRQSRKVSQDHEISYLGTLYSVPWQLSGREVDVEETGDGRLRIYHLGSLVAEHGLQTSGVRRVRDQAHDDGLTAFQTRRGVNGLALLPEGLPVVEARPLSTYEELAHA